MPHVPDLQVLHDDDGVVPHKAARRLVLGISSPARMASLQAAKPQDRPLAIARSLLSSRNGLLDGSELALFLSANARQVEDLAIRGGDGVGDAESYI